MFAGLTFGGAVILAVVIFYFRSAIKSVADTTNVSVQHLSQGVRKQAAYYAVQLVADAEMETEKLRQELEQAQRYDPEALLKSL